MSYMNKTIQSYYDIKERYDKGLPIDTRSLIDSGILNYSAILTCLKRLGFLRKIENGVYDLKNLSHIELMALSDDYLKCKQQRRDRKKEDKKEKEIDSVSEKQIDNYELLKYFPIGGIENYKDDEILAELKKRGYEGELFLTVKQKVTF